MTGIGSYAAEEAAVTAGPDACPLPSLSPSDGGGPASRAVRSTVVNFLSAAPRRLWRAQPSAREGVWVNTAQPPDDPETSWPSTVFNPFASESSEMVVPTGPPTEDLVPLPEADGGYSCPSSPADPDGNRHLLARRRRGRHAAPSVGIGSRLARKLAANR
jgi:hypothetical protein